jgi:hypothetical protein
MRRDLSAHGARAKNGRRSDPRAEGHRALALFRNRSTTASASVSRLRRVDECVGHRPFEDRDVPGMLSSRRDDETAGRIWREHLT